MRIMFVHQNFPAQFGHVADYLQRKFHHECVFVTRKKGAASSRVKVVNYNCSQGATKATHYCSRPFENSVWEAWGAKELLERRFDVEPDLIVGHSGFGSTLFLQELYPRAKLVNYFEYFYRSKGSDLDFRPDFPSDPNDRFRSRARNAMILLDLNACDRGYCPTHYQHATLPQEYRDKVEVHFDGVDTRLWRPCVPADRKIGGWVVPRGCKLVTYATRGMEAMRGFDIFVNVARQLSRERSDVVFAIAGEDRVAYGGDTRHTGGKTLKQYLEGIAPLDSTRFRFLGRLPPAELAKLLSLSDLHFYLTVPFILSWSVFDALACGSTILASDTGPVREVISHEKNGLLVNFFDEEGFLDQARRVLKDPAAFRPLGKAGQALIQEKYSYEVCLPRIADLFHRVAGAGSAGVEQPPSRNGSPATSPPAPAPTQPTAGKELEAGAAFNRLCLFYDDQAYVEQVQPTLNVAPGAPMGLMGRQVAGKEFLDAYLTHGQFTELSALVNNRQSKDSLGQLWKTHPATRRTKRRLRFAGAGQLRKHFHPGAAASVIHFPVPLDSRYAWARQHLGHHFALSGVTHTLSSLAITKALCEMLTAPFEPYDALVCTSRAAVDLVRSVTGTYADFLRERHGGTPRLPVRLEIIPLGVNTDKFHPPTPAERAARRAALGAADDEVVVLFVGRMSFHAKAHPFPLYEGVARAARATGRKVHLILSGWAANEAIRLAFQDGARQFAPGVRVSFPDSLDPDSRTGIWHAADLFASLPDSIQETFGLTMVQALACGLPVVATDWNGYRDIITADTGLLVPTYMVRDASADATFQLVVGEIDESQFMGHSSQTVSVDLAAAAEAFTRLIGDDALRQRMGNAARQRALDHYAWPHVIRAYETLWRSQESERQVAAARAGGPRNAPPGPSFFPAPEHSFGRFPTAVLDGDARLQSEPRARERVEVLLSMKLTNYYGEGRSTDPAVIGAVLDAAAAPRSLADLDGVLRQRGVSHGQGRATLAWMLKYGLLRTAGR